MKIVKSIALGLFFLMGSCASVACDEIEFRLPTFEEKCVTTEDGFTYYIDKDIGLCIIDIPDAEEVTIPETIDGDKVVQFGYKDIGLGYSNEYYVDFSMCKKVVINSYIIGKYVYGSYKIETLVFNNYPYVGMKDAENGELTVPIKINANYEKPSTIVELRKTKEREVVNSLDFDTIIIPEYVSIIEDGVFDGLESVKIKTSYASQPDGWEEGWNGTCIVEWGANIEAQYAEA